MTTELRKFAILCGSGQYEDFLSEVDIVRTRDLDEAFEEADNVCSNIETGFVFPINKTNIDKIKKIIDEAGDKND